ncbi:hypothetical protein jhhlp_004274 [Lomentospora prolificans]|uniref:2-oxoadipate dioxygenase/decarboxylase n=1 Tax=Lomentospora prolificans TaxID=41688 RepID=A0A2N3NB20_9PEZI|nr:hypothetical protein jhhlp_004274 [Lomentospora prolificans]
MPIQKSSQSRYFSVNSQFVNMESLPCSPAFDQDELRTKFTLALSEMYKSEVPLYGDLIKIVRKVDDLVLRRQGLNRQDLPVRHDLERHGAIRIGSDQEMRVIKRLFAVLGMHPVGYYDLTVVDFPLHATAFRPISEDSLASNPFRVFTSVLRKDLLLDETREIIEKILDKRSLFTPRLLEILEAIEANASLDAQDMGDLVVESLKIFKWHGRSTVSLEDYTKLKKEHPMIADIVCFPSAHINHLTPRTLDIDFVQEEMIKQNLPAKSRIEGPPCRKCPILLRQTSFKALEEAVSFPNIDGGLTPGSHTARFGEIEQRGAAVTRQGRDLYDELLREATKMAADETCDLDAALAKAFEAYPDDWDELRTRGLVYFRYRVATDHRDGHITEPTQNSSTLEDLISSGVIECEPITYEDFLPLSAAGIFKSNLGEVVSQSPIREASSSMSDLEDILGCKIISQFDLYDRLQQESLDKCVKELGLSEIMMH